MSPLDLALVCIIGFTVGFLLPSSTRMFKRKKYASPITEYYFKALDSTLEKLRNKVEGLEEKQKLQNALMRALLCHLSLETNYIGNGFYVVRNKEEK